MPHFSHLNRRKKDNLILIVNITYVWFSYSTTSPNNTQTTGREYVEPIRCIWIFSQSSSHLYGLEVFSSLLRRRRRRRESLYQDYSVLFCRRLSNICMAPSSNLRLSSHWTADIRTVSILWHPWLQINGPLCKAWTFISYLEKKKERKIYRLRKFVCNEIKKPLEIIMYVFNIKCLISWNPHISLFIPLLQLPFGI